MKQSIDSTNTENGQLSIGILGIGSFGAFVASILPKHAMVYGYDKHPRDFPKGIRPASFDKVLTCDVIILAIPLEVYEKVLPRIAAKLKPEQLLIDTCSVKVLPYKIIRRFLPKHQNLLLTHPLFGPHSYGKDKSYNKLIVTRAKGALAHKALKYGTEVCNLEVVRLTEHQHDRLMADIHVLTFFVARGLSRLPQLNHDYITPSYKMIIDLVQFDRDHTDELFMTIQKGNPYATATNKRVVQIFAKLQKEIEKSNKIKSYE